MAKLGALDKKRNGGIVINEAPASEGGAQPEAVGAQEQADIDFYWEFWGLHFLGSYLWFSLIWSRRT